MYAFKHAPARIKLLALINLAVLLLLVFIFPVLKIEYVLFLVAGYVAYFLVNIMYLIHEKKAIREQIWLPDIGYGKKAFHFLRHFLLPVIEVLGFTAAIFFIKVFYINILLALFEGYMFFVLITNIRSFFANAQVTELKTHFVYDLLALATTFLALFSLFEAKSYWGLHQIVVLVVMFIYLAALINFEAMRYQVRIFSLYPWLAIICTFITCLLSFLGIISSIRTVIATTLILYIYLNLLHNLKEDTPLTLGLVCEYIVLIATAILIMVTVTQ